MPEVLVDKEKFEGNEAYQQNQLSIGDISLGTTTSNKDVTPYRIDIIGEMWQHVPHRKKEMRKTKKREVEKEWETNQ